MRASLDLLSRFWQWLKIAWRDVRADRMSLRRASMLRGDQYTIAFSYQ